MTAPPPDSLLRFLPAIYATPANPFITGYLNIFQKLLVGLDDAQLDGRHGIQELLSAQVIGNLFYPRFSFLFPGSPQPIPPISGLDSKQEAAVLAAFDAYIGVPRPATAADQKTFIAWLDDVLVWLGDWVGLTPDNTWTIDKKRTVLAQILALFRTRATPQGMGWLVNLWLDLPLTITGDGYDEQGVIKPGSVSGVITVTIANPAVSPVTLAASAADKSAFVLRENAVPGMPLVSGFAPWLFLVRIVLPNSANKKFFLNQSNIACIQGLQRQLTALIESFKPAGTCFRLVLSPGMELRADGRASILGINSLLGSGETA